MPSLTLLHDDADASFVPENETAPDAMRGANARTRGPLRALVGAATFVAVIAVCVIAVATHVARAALRRRPASVRPAATRLNAGARP